MITASEVSKKPGAVHIDAVAEGLGFRDDSAFNTLFVHVISERAGSVNDDPGVAIYVAQDLTT